jgi:hypothetical protein
MSIFTIASLGDDALANNFEVILPPTFPGAVDALSTAIRCTTATIPEKSTGKYSVEYKSQTFTKPSGKITTPNEFSFTFRVDKYWNTYRGLRNWLNIIGDGATGIQSADYVNGASIIRVPISIITLDSAGAETSIGWNFDGCYISSLDGVTFDQSSGDPLEVSATFDFITMLN